jgi:hypothetical protein
MFAVASGLTDPAFKPGVAAADSGLMNNEQETRIRTLASALHIDGDYRAVCAEIARRARVRGGVELNATMTIVSCATEDDAAWAWACGLNALPHDRDCDLRAALYDAELQSVKPGELLTRVIAVVRNALNEPPSATGGREGQSVAGLAPPGGRHVHPLAV